MLYTLALVASTAAAWPFMAPDLSPEKRAAMLQDTTGRVLGEAAVRSAREKRQGILGGGPLGGGLCTLNPHYATYLLLTACQWAECFSHSVAYSPIWTFRLLNPKALRPSTATFLVTPLCLLAREM